MKLFYTFQISERKTQYGNTIWDKHTHLPHRRQIEQYVKTTWDKVKKNIQDNLPDEIAQNIKNMTMQFPKQRSGACIAKICIEPKPKFKWSEQRKNIVWNELDIQMTDGFGECIDHHVIAREEDAQYSIEL